MDPIDTARLGYSDLVFTAIASDHPQLATCHFWPTVLPLRSHRTGAVRLFRILHDERNGEGELVAVIYHDAGSGCSLRVYND